MARYTRPISLRKMILSILGVIIIQLTLLHATILMRDGRKKK